MAWSWVGVGALRSVSAMVAMAEFDAPPDHLLPLQQRMQRPLIHRNTVESPHHPPSTPRHSLQAVVNVEKGHI
jgi:hypothetical protein